MRLRFTGPPGPQAPGLIEIEDNQGNAIRVGEWQRDAASPDWFLVLNVEYLLDRITNLFTEIRGDFIDPRSQCEEGRKAVGRLRRILLGREAA